MSYSQSLPISFIFKGPIYLAKCIFWNFIETIWRCWPLWCYFVMMLGWRYRKFFLCHHFLSLKDLISVFFYALQTNFASFWKVFCRLVFSLKSRNLWRFPSNCLSKAFVGHLSFLSFYLYLNLEFTLYQGILILFSGTKILSSASFLLPSGIAFAQP